MALRIREIRQRNHLLLRDLQAKLAAVGLKRTIPALHYIETGQRNITLKHLQLFAQVLGVDWRELANGETATFEQEDTPCLTP